MKVSPRDQFIAGRELLEEGEQRRGELMFECHKMIYRAIEALRAHRDAMCELTVEIRMADFGRFTLALASA